MNNDRLAPQEDDRVVYITSFRAKERPAISADVFLERSYTGGPDTLSYKISRAFKPGRTSNKFRYTDKMFSGMGKYVKEVVDQAEVFIRRHMHDPESALQTGELLNAERANRAARRRDEQNQKAA